MCDILATTFLVGAINLSSGSKELETRSVELQQSLMDCSRFQANLNLGYHEQHQRVFVQGTTAELTFRLKLR